MSATPAQFAELAGLFGKAGATALIDYVRTQVSPQATAADALGSAVTALGIPKAVAYPTRALDTDFVIDANNDYDVRYTVLLPIKLTVAGTDEAIVALVVNGSEIHRVRNTMSLVGLSINDNRSHEHVLSGRVPAGATVNLTTVAASATAAAPSIRSCQEAQV